MANGMECAPASAASSSRMTAAGGSTSAAVGSHDPPTRDRRGGPSAAQAASSTPYKSRAADKKAAGLSPGGSYGDRSGQMADRLVHVFRFAASAALLVFLL